MEKKKEAYRYEHDDYNVFELVFNRNYKKEEQVEIVDKATYQMDNDVSVRLPPKVAISFAEKILENFQVAVAAITTFRNVMICDVSFSTVAP